MAGGLGQAAGDYTAQDIVEAQAAFDPMLQASSAPAPVRAATAMLAPLTAQLGMRPAARRGGYSSELECLTEAVYYEARGETPRGQAAVAQVVMNRVKHPAFPKTVCGVVFQGSTRRTGCQFSFACDGSMSARHEKAAWQRARSIAARTLAGVVVADVGSATHYHTIAVSPAWGSQMRQVAQVGLHVFYRFAPRKPGVQMPGATEAVLASLPQQGSAAADVRLTSAPLETAADAAEAAKPASSETPAAAVAKAETTPAAPPPAVQTSAS